MVHVTEQLLEDLYEAQKNHLIHVLQTNRNGDDGGDYISSALDLFSALQQMTRDQCDTRALEVMLNSAPNHDVEGFDYLAYEADENHPQPPTVHIVNIGVLASDGIADAIYRLDPPVLG